MTKEEKIKKILENIRPAIQADGGDVVFVSYDAEKEIVLVKLKGSCAHCPMANITLKNGIEKVIKKNLPEIKSVEAV